jgi:hypothetical protein
VAGSAAAAIVEMSTQNVSGWLRNLGHRETCKCEQHKDNEENPLHGTRPHFALFRLSAGF